MTIPKINQRVRTPDGPGVVTRYTDYGTLWVRLEVRDMDRPMREYMPAAVRPETFAEFCSRPTGFGLTSWPQFGLIVGLGLAMVVTGIVSETWASTVWGLMVVAGLVLGTWMNFTRRWV